MQVDSRTDYFHTIEWRIHNFSSSILMEGEEMDSPISTAGNLYYTRWIARIYPNGQQKYPKFLGCYVRRDEEEKVGPETLHIGFEFSLLSFDGVELFTKKSSEEFKRGTCFGFPKFAELQEIFCRKEYLLQADMLAIRCKLQLLPSKKKQTSIQIFESKFSTQIIRREMTLTNFRSISKQNPRILQVKGNKDLLEILVSMNKDETSEEQVANGAKPETSSGSFLHMVMKKNIWKDPVHVSCCIKLLNKISDVAIEKEFNHLFCQVNEKEEWVLPYFIDTNNLGNDCIENDSLYLNFHFTVCDSQPMSVQTADLTPLKVRNDLLETTMKKDLTNLHETPKFSDVTIRIGQEKFQAHKSVLAVRSPRFDEIFTTNTNSENHIIDVTDVDIDTMELLLKFIYTDTLDDDISAERCFLLYVAAKKYQISSLQHRCSKNLCRKVSIKEVYNVLLAAVEFGDSKLKMGTIDFFLRHYQHILLTPEWQIFAEKHGELAEEIMRHIRIKKKKEAEE